MRHKSEARAFRLHTTLSYRLPVVRLALHGASRSTIFSLALKLHVATLIYPELCLMELWRGLPDVGVCVRALQSVELWVASTPACSGGVILGHILGGTWTMTHWG